MMHELLPDVATPILRGPGGRQLRIAHLTTVDMSLALLLGVELRVDTDAGLQVFGISAPGDYVDLVESWGVDHVPIRQLTRAWHPGSDVAAVRELAAELRRLRLDVLHTHTPKAGVLGRVLGRLARIPVVVNTCHGLWLRDGDSRLRRAGVLVAEGLAAAISHAELYQNAEDAERLRWVVRGSRGRVVGNGTDLDVFGPDHAARTRVRTELGLAADAVLIGGVGRRVREKGIADLADVARRLNERAEFVWIGDADEVDPLPEEDIRGLRLLGQRSDMAAVYNALDLFVLPSWREGMSRSAMEAAATGLPMILSDIRGCREIGTHDRDLILVPPGDPDALASAVEALLVDAGTRERLGASARTHALGHFDQRGVALASLRAYCDRADSAGMGWQVDDPAGVLR